MSDQKNLILAVVFSLLVLFIYQKVFVEPQLAEQRVVEFQSLADDGGQGFFVEGSAIEGPGAIPETTTSSTLEPSPRIEIATMRLSGSLALRGARFDDLILNDYVETLDDDSPNIRILKPGENNGAYYAEFGWASREGSDLLLPDSNTIWSTTDHTLRTENPIELVWDNGAGLTFRRIISIDDNYVFTIQDMVENRSGAPIDLAPYGLIARHETPEISKFFILHEGPLGVFDEGLEEIDYDDLAEDGPVRFQSTGGWMGITDKYWLTALIPDQNMRLNARFMYRNQGGDRYQIDYLGTAQTIGNGETITSEASLFVGAKEVQLIDAYEDDLGIPLFDRSIDWGWFYFLTKPIFYTLEFLFGIFGNFGVAILVLTVFIKLLFFRLATKQYTSMSKMKKLQPKMTELRERYKDDKAKQQQEIMALYKKEKVNPAAGCLPILLQIPVFFALYKTLFVTIEMRQKPFFGWIQDLSAPDDMTFITLFGYLPWDAPTFLLIGIWPIFMGLTMFLQMRLNPQSPDPIQAKIFMFMPIFFTFILASFPAGLVIYWTWNNLLSILQQWLIMRRMGVRVGD